MTDENQPFAPCIEATSRDASQGVRNQEGSAPCIEATSRDESPSDMGQSGSDTFPAEAPVALENGPLPGVPPLEPSVAAVLKEILHPEDQKPTYQITLPVFDGPMDLLLHLIKEHEVDIYDIPIALLTKEYLAVLEIMQALNLEVAGDFLVMAATLMQIKSRMLLPLEPTADGEEPEDPRAELVRRLIEYKQFKDAADRLGDLEKDRGRLFPRNMPETWKESAEEQHLVEVTLFGLLSAFKDVLIHSQQDFTTELLHPEVTVTQKINDLMDLLQEKRELEFKTLLGPLRSKIEKIVTFLALLELIRLKLVVAFQMGPFGEIRLYLTENAPSDEATSRGGSQGVRSEGGDAADVERKERDPEDSAPEREAASDGVLPEGSSAKVKRRRKRTGKRKKGDPTPENAVPGQGQETGVATLEASAPEIVPDAGIAPETPAPGTN